MPADGSPAPDGPPSAARLVVGLKLQPQSIDGFLIHLNNDMIVFDLAAIVFDREGAVWIDVGIVHSRPNTASG